MHHLEEAITRQINRVIVLPLHGAPFPWDTVDDAIRFVEGYSEMGTASKLIAKYEIQIRYDNGDSIEGEFVDKDRAVAFLRTYLPSLRPTPDSVT